MATRRSKPAAKAPKSRARVASKAGQPLSTEGRAAVDAYMARLEHPHKDAIEALRAIILGSHATIAEGVKWNAPSFRTSEYFATVHLRAKQGVALILHLGAKRRDGSGVEIDDPKGLLEWLGRERAMVSFEDLAATKERKAALAKIVRQWITSVS